MRYYLCTFIDDHGRAGFHWELNSKDNSVRTMGILGINTSSFLPCQVRLIVSRWHVREAAWLLEFQCTTLVGWDFWEAQAFQLLVEVCGEEHQVAQESGSE